MELGSKHQCSCTCQWLSCQIKLLYGDRNEVDPHEAQYRLVGYLSVYLGLANGDENWYYSDAQYTPKHLSSHWKLSRVEDKLFITPFFAKRGQIVLESMLCFCSRKVKVFWTQSKDDHPILTSYMTFHLCSLLFRAHNRVWGPIIFTLA